MNFAKGNPISNFGWKLVRTGLQISKKFHQNWLKIGNFGWKSIRNWRKLVQSPILIKISFCWVLNWPKLVVNLVGKTHLQIWLIFGLKLVEIGWKFGWFGRKSYKPIHVKIGQNLIRNWPRIWQGKASDQFGLGIGWNLVRNWSEMESSSKFGE